ncbi:hypothetical protein pdam_00021352, partial [Pocillopora damicornis]
EPGKKKEKEGGKIRPGVHLSSSSFAKHAAELQIEMISKCKDWGFLLKKQFGSHLGSGDYGHLVVNCSAMLLQHFHSFHKYSGQGFDSSHKLHHQLYSKATNRDVSEPGQS